MARVTLRDVADRAGVSHATASLVLRGQGRVSAETRQRVMTVLQEMGYVDDRVAAAAYGSLQIILIRVVLVVSTRPQSGRRRRDASTELTTVPVA